MCLDKQDKNTALHYPAGCYVVGITLIGCIGIAVGSLAIVHINAIPTLANKSLLRAHIMCGAFGMLGATMAAIRKYYQFLITQSSKGQLSPSDWSIGWVYYYLTRPILGSLLGALSFMLSFIGVQVLAKPADLQISHGGTYLLYAIAFVSGFSVSHVLDRLERLAQRIFKWHHEEMIGLLSMKN